MSFVARSSDRRAASGSRIDMVGVGAGIVILSVGGDVFNCNTMYSDGTNCQGQNGLFRGWLPGGG